MIRSFIMLQELCMKGNRISSNQISYFYVIVISAMNSILIDIN